MRRPLLTLIVLLWSAAVWGQAKSDSARPGLAITHVNVIDATGAPAQPDQTVVISDGRIVALGKSAGVSIPANAEIVDATGKFLIPGLWDMHAHIAAAGPADAEEYLNLFLANGVTGVREMHSFFNHPVSWVLASPQWRPTSVNPRLQAQIWCNPRHIRSRHAVFTISSRQICRLLGKLLGEQSLFKGNHAQDCRRKHQLPAEGRAGRSGRGGVDW